MTGRRGLVLGLARVGLLAMLLAAAGAPAATAQGVQGTGTAGGDAIEINADDGIEWLRDAKQYRARGNATATRGGVQVKGDTLIAYYRGGEDGERQVIYRLDAVGNVTITSADGIAFGDKGVYHVEKRVAVLVGEDLHLVTENSTITAEESLEYWEGRSLAVARGDAQVARDDKRLRAGVLTAFIKQAEGSGTGSGDARDARVTRIDATGGVHVSTEDEIVIGNEGVYDVPREKITLCGDVKITRQQNQLNGECAIVDMKTGRSRLEGRGEKVEGLILPTQ